MLGVWGVGENLVAHAAVVDHVVAQAKLLLDHRGQRLHPFGIDRGKLLDPSENGVQLGYHRRDLVIAHRDARQLGDMADLLRVHTHGGAASSEGQDGQGGCEPAAPPLTPPAMCARRFLLVIFWLTLIVVAGAFAIYQFGGSVLIDQTIPKGHFVAPPTTVAPDYADDTSWLAKPGLPNDPSSWLPVGVGRVPSARKAAVFYVHPTTYLARDKWNAAFDEGGETAFRDKLFVQSQASAFADVGPIWAPRYRQAAFGAFLLKSDDAHRALDLAYHDVLAAFDVFLAAQPSGSPIILAGHSQGALHLSRLLVDRRQQLAGRLVAAYVVGWPLSASADLPATGLRSCDSPAATDCVLSWLSFTVPANGSLVLDNWVGTSGSAGKVRAQSDLVCVNPLTGTRNGVAPPGANLGTLVPTADFASATLLPSSVGASCSEGLLEIDGAIPALGPYVLPGNNYHVYDYALFWGSIRADAARRVAAWR